MGSRSLANHLTTPEAPLGRDRARRLMLIMGIESLAPQPGTSKRQPKHPVYPYLLRGMTIDQPNQSGLPISPTSHGTGIHVLDSDHGLGDQKSSDMAIVQHAGYQILLSRRSKKLFSNTCPQYLQFRPGCQFTSEAFTSVLKTWNVRISMDGKGRFRDNIFIERLWRTLKYDRIYLNSYETGAELSKDMTYWFNYYNDERKHTSLTNGHQMRFISKDLKN